MEKSNEQLSKTNKPSYELHLFWHQVTGHNILLKYDKHTLCKPLKDREVLLYSSVPAYLEPFVPRYKGAIDVAWVEDENNVAHLIGTLVDPSLENCDTSRRSRQNSTTSDIRVKIVHSSDDQVEIEAPKNVDGKMAFEVRSTSLQPWSLEHCASALNKLRLSIERDGVKRFILLENLTQRFSQPCVLDLKMGTRLYGDDEPEAKKERKIKRSLESTSYELGVRLGGMQVYDVKLESYRTRDKFYGRLLSPAQFKASVYDFLNNGKRFRFELIEPFKRRLYGIIEALKRLVGFRFFSSSLLLIYDGFQIESDANAPSSSCNDSLVDVRMVDFEWSTWPTNEGDISYPGPDTGYLLGLKTIIGYLDELQLQLEDTSSP